MDPMKQKDFWLGKVLGIGGLFLLCALPLEAGRRGGGYKDPSLLGNDHGTLSRHRARMDRKVTRFDLCEGGLPQKPFMTKGPRVSFSSGVDCAEEGFSSKSGRRIDGGGSKGLFLPLLLLMSVATSVEGQVFHLEPQCGGLVVVKGAAVCGCPGGERCGLMTPDRMWGLSCCAALCCGTGSRADDHHSLSPTKTFTETSSPSDTHTITPPPPLPSPPPPPPPLPSPPPPPPPSCAMASPPIGITCADGSFYAGKHPVTGAKVYAMNQDSSSRLYWNDGSSNWLDLPAPMDNCGGTAGTAGCHDGKTYTAYLAGLTTPSPAPYKAAQYCANLVALGYSDWYLPSKDELQMLYTNLGPAPARGFKSNWYWSSSEYSY